MLEGPPIHARDAVAGSSGCAVQNQDQSLQCHQVADISLKVSKEGVIVISSSETWSKRERVNVRIQDCSKDASCGAQSSHQLQTG